jgi:FkbM family methyltransferase
MNLRVQRTLFLVSLACVVVYFYLQTYPLFTRSPRAVLSSTITDHDWWNFVQNFQAQNKKYEDWCKGKLLETIPSTNNPAQTSQGLGSQYQQDLYLIRNIFPSLVTANRPGFYIDSGANHAEALSNTLFFDVCLGWSGICVEPNPEYHDEITKKRSCTLVPECISDETKEQSFIFLGETGHVASSDDSNTKQVLCRTLDEMLVKYANGRTYVDLWSLDVEGYEMTILNSINWSKLNFNAILIETFWLSDRLVDYFMTELGFAKLQQLAIDSLYVKLNHSTGWRPPQWNEIWHEQMQFRNEMRTKGKLNAEL